MVNIDIVYEGSLHCALTHGPSGIQINTDAPKDNHGKGEAFSPTDLVAGALGACLLTIMGIVAQRHEIKIEGARVRVIKEMVQEPVRRIGKLTATLTLPSGIPSEKRKLLEHAAHTCPVHKSLHPDVQVLINFVYPD